jgi:rfaE bifunctional protein kinase chain/domain
MPTRTPHEIIDAFKGLRILIIGDVMLDSYIWGAIDRISPEAPVPVVRIEKRDFRLGGAANVALNVKSMGGVPLVCALIGKDDAGQKLKNIFKDEGLSVGGLIESPSRPTTIKTRVIANQQHVVRVDEESDSITTGEEEQKLWAVVEKHLPSVKAVIFEDYDKGCISEALIERIVTRSKELDVPTVVDPKKRNFLSYKDVTLFKPNIRELREGLKIDLDAANENQIREAVAQLSKILNAGVMVTLSEHGVYIDYKGEKLKLPAHQRKIADVSGAGDTVVSICGLCVALGLDARNVAALSNLGGGLVCQHVGVVPINFEELRREAEHLS